jgi:hypothetical protein
MFGALIAIVIASAMILGAVCGIFYLTEGRIPRPLFDIFFASLWPSKGEDIGTIIADSIDADEDCSRWSTAGYREVFSSTDRQFTVQSDVWNGRAQLGGSAIGSYGDTVTASTWADHRLYKSIKAWKVRKALVAEKAAIKRAEEALNTARNILKKPSRERA